MNKTTISLFKQKAMQLASIYEVCCCLDSNNYTDPYSQYDCLIAFGVQEEIKINAGEAFSALKSFHESNKDWMFGLLSYELKNETEQLTTNHEDQLEFPDLYFFVPKYLIALQGDEIKVLKGDEGIIDAINKVSLANFSSSADVKIESRFDKKNYINTVEKLQAHIKRGDIYEVNFCQEFFANNAKINPLAIYQELNELSPTPFAGFFKIYNHYIISATPERFLCKRGNQLISQPIKGTAKRSTDLIEDEQIKINLKSSIKEQAENVMIVDLVRNDLTKSAVQGTVQVDELFGIYTFPQVHQMISTISCELNPEVHFVDAIKNTFPMGSMTGAPKIKAMQLIDTYERNKRGAFSGSFGCISPDGDFDFNVIIRSILYNSNRQYLSFQVGGAITYAAKAEDEYEECLLKASAILKVLGGV
ncbi:anthranilate synthase component I family protein [Pedobacter frigiditerrae]|uniref:Anthranilate synthase component I family protein n=1 Tax=Pedobacter frigiditerrae TaxID=2530452 RepID=A0A4R0MRH6_9SPHI|nr:anthranilate synthase component I family protein [Pedobacter frigiditerrae]TCC89500.1 anthranilate synthase component I family protein [Pedobacter frigiditerrae]